MKHAGFTGVRRWRAEEGVEGLLPVLETKTIILNEEIA